MFWKKQQNASLIITTIEAQTLLGDSKLYNGSELLNPINSLTIPNYYGTQVYLDTCHTMTNPIENIQKITIHTLR